MDAGPTLQAKCNQSVLSSRASYPDRRGASANTVDSPSFGDGSSDVSWSARLSYLIASARRLQLRIIFGAIAIYAIVAV